MRNDRMLKMTRGLSVAASNSLLLLSVVGGASAHPATASGVFADGDALRARIMSMEPDLDENEVDELVESVMDAMDEADDDAAGAEDAADEDDDQARRSATARATSARPRTRATTIGPSPTTRTTTAMRTRTTTTKVTTRTRKAITRTAARITSPAITRTAARITVRRRLTFRARRVLRPGDHPSPAGRTKPRSDGPGLPELGVGDPVNARDLDEQQLSALPLVEPVGTRRRDGYQAHSRCRPKRLRLDIDQEPASTEVLRDIDDAAGFPTTADPSPEPVGTAPAGSGWSDRGRSSPGPMTDRP